MQVSHSRIEAFKNCAFKYKMRYIDGIRTLKPDEPDNALFLGTALHTGIEKGVNEGINEYFMQYPVITDGHINEAMKLEVVVPRAKKLLPEGSHEVKIEDEDFVGYIDLLAPATGFHDGVIPGLYDIYDFKYSNNVDHYKESVQLHLYKYFFEKNNPGKKIRNLYFLFVPKVNIKQKKTESLEEFRMRIQKELETAEPRLVQIEYDQGKVVDWLSEVKHTIEATDFPKNQSWLCRYCEYKTFCESNGETTYDVILPHERRPWERR